MRDVPGVGPRNPELIGLGEAPGEEEEIQGQPFVGPSGKVLDGILASAGLQRSECYLDNVIPIRPPNNKMERLGELGLTIDQFRPHLEKVVRGLDCGVVVAFGETPLNHLTNQTGITKHRGSIYPCTLDPSKVVVPTFHPRFVIENFKMRGVVVEDVKKAIRLTQGGRRTYQFNTKIRPTLHEVEEAISYLSRCSTLSFDIEVVGSGQVACVGVGTVDDRTGHRQSICIPFKYGYNNYWGPGDEIFIWKLLQQLFQGTQLKIGQNINYDLTKLLPFIGEPSPPWFDLMVAHHCCDPELPHTLAFMTSIYTDINYYKDDPKDEELSWKYATSSEQLWEYNGKDVEVNLILEPFLREELKGMGLLSRFEGFDMAKMRVAWRMQQRGLLVDRQKREELFLDRMKKLIEAQAKLRDLVGYDLNPCSSKQMINFLYNELKIPPHYQRKTRKLTADQETLEELLTRHPHPAFQVAMDIRENVKDVGTYLATKDKKTGEYSLEKEDPDGRMRTRVNVCGTATGRTSNKKTYTNTGLDLQNVPEDLREMFWAGEGRVLEVWDLWQAEAYAVAIFANCQSYLDKLMHGQKIHRMVAGWIFKKPEELVDKVNKPGGEYFLGKRTVHASDYGLGWNKFLMIVNSDIRIHNQEHPDSPKEFITAARAKEILGVIDTFAPEIKQWHLETQEELQRTRMLETPLGRKRIFRGRVVDKRSGKFDQDTARKAYAHRPQSTVGEYLHQAQIKLEYLLPEGAEIVQEGFDALIIERPEEMDISKLVALAFDKQLYWRGTLFKIPVEMASCGSHWKK